MSSELDQTDSGVAVFEWASDKQKEAVEADSSSPLLLIGGFNASKTSSAILHMLALCDNFPGYKVAVLRKTFKDLSMTTRPSFDQWIDPKRVKQASATEVTLDNGSSFIFHHLDSPASATVLRGLEVSGCILDQAEQMQERTFTILLGRLGRWKGASVPKWVIQKYTETVGGPWPWKNRAGHPVPPISLVLTANPTEDGDPELHWLWQRFSQESKAWQDKWRLQGYRQIVMPTTGNKFAGEQNVEMLLRQDEDYVKRYVRGEWVRSKGHLFTLDDMSIVDYEPEIISYIENTCILGMALDHGDSAPTCCLFYGVDRHDNILCVAPETKVLTADLRWVEAGTVTVGDNLVGFEEEASRRYRQRKWERALVQSVTRVVRPSYKLTLSDGTIVTCSEDHQWLIKAQGGTNTKWVQTKDLASEQEGRPSHRTGPKTNAGDQLMRLFDIWETGESYVAGYYVGEMGFIKGVGFPVLVKKEFVGDKAVIAIQTSSRTYVAEGLASHNCYKEYFQSGMSEDGKKEFNIEDHRRAITALSKGLTFRVRLADPSIFSKTRNISGYTRKQQRWSVASEYSDSKLMSESTKIHFTPADNNEALSRSRLSQYLKLDGNHKHPFSGERCAPHIYFVKKCDEWPHGVEHAIRDIRNAKRLVVAENDGKPVYSDDRDPGIPDHSLDCLAPETRILTNDLQWVPIETVKVGDVVIGFQEVAGTQCHGRRWERSIVLRTERVTKPCYRVVFEDGTTVVCSDDHQWLVRIAGTTNSAWQKTEDLDGISHRSPRRARSRPSGVNRVIKVMDVWETDESRDAAYLAGALDGEGCVSKSSLTFSQKENEMLERVCLILDKKGINYSKSACGRERDVMSVRIHGGFRSVLKVLGEIRPVRLIPRIKIDRRLEGTPLRIIKREFVGDTEVIALETSTHTFFAEGLASHNCVRYIVNSRPLPASTPMESRKLTAEARGGGRVIVTIPPVIDKKPNLRDKYEKIKWKSRGGGYALAFLALSAGLIV